MLETFQGAKDLNFGWIYLSLSVITYDVFLVIRCVTLLTSLKIPGCAFFLLPS